MEAEKILSGHFESDMQTLYGSMIVDGGRWQEAIGFAMSPDPPLAFRAAWGLEWAFFKDRAGFMPHIDAFVAAFVASDNGSVHRHYAKMIAHLLKDGHRFAPDQKTAILEKSFDLLISPTAKVAVKGWCMQIIYMLRDTEDWIVEALESTLRNILAAPDITPGMANGAAKTLKKLQSRR